MDDIIERRRQANPILKGKSLKRKRGAPIDGNVGTDEPETESGDDDEIESSEDDEGTYPFPTVPSSCTYVLRLSS